MAVGDVVLTGAAAGGTGAAAVSLGFVVTGGELVAVAGLVTAADAAAGVATGVDTEASGATCLSTIGGGAACLSGAADTLLGAALDLLESRVVKGGFEFGLEA